MQKDKIFKKFSNVIVHISIFFYLALYISTSYLVAESWHDKEYDMIIAITHARNRIIRCFSSVHDRLLTYIYIYTRSSNHPLIAGRTRKRATITEDLLRLRFTCCSIGAGESNKNRRSRFATRRGVASFRNQIVRFPRTDFRFYRNFNSEKGKKNR